MQERPQVVIVGAGFGGLLAARKLHRANADITVIDRTNHHLFQPLLYQVATAALAPTDITGAIRHTLRNQKNTTVVLGEVSAADLDARTVTVLDPNGGVPPTTLPFDYLIIAAGTRHSYFAHPEWERFAPGLKTIVDAIEMRRRFLLAFEEAERAQSAEERKAWLTFVIVGGGPTGCELAGVMQEIAAAMRDEFRHIDTRETRVILIEAGPRILPAFPESLAEHARRDLEELRVEVRTGNAVTDVRADGVSVGSDEIPTHTVFWAAGNVGSPLVRAFGVPLNRAGQVVVERDLSVPGHPNVFVIGDLAHALQNNGQPAPGVAQVAMQEGRVAAHNVLASINRTSRKDFDYFNKGDLATIGRSKAIANLFGGKVQLTGRLAWWLWLLIHITYLIGFRNRLSVMLQWAYAYFTYQRGARLITPRRPRAAGD